MRGTPGPSRVSLSVLSGSAQNHVVQADSDLQIVFKNTHNPSHTAASTEQTAASTEQIAASAQSLASTSEHLDERVAQFTLVGG